MYFKKIMNGVVPERPAEWFFQNNIDFSTVQYNSYTHLKLHFFSFLEAKQSMKMKLKSKLNPFRFTKIPPHQSMVTNVFKGSDLALDKEMCEILQDNWSQKHFTKRILLYLLWSNSHVAKRKMTQP